MMPQSNGKKTVPGRELVISIHELNALVTRGVLSFECCKGGQGRGRGRPRAAAG